MPSMKKRVLGIAAAAVFATFVSGGSGAAGDSSDPVPPPGVIAFSRWDDAVGDFAVFTVSSDGTDEQQLLDGAHEIPRWSPDGATVSMTAVTPSGRVVPALVNADGRDYRELSVDATLNCSPAGWSPDGALLLCEAWDDADAARAGIYTIRASDGGGLTRLTESRDVPGGYSPDGRSIVFVRLESDETGRLWIMDADGSNPRQLIERTVGLGTSFSPDGTMVLADGYDGTVFTVDVGSGQIHEIPLPADGIGYVARWSPDGEWLVLSIHLHREPNADIYAVRLDGTGLTQLTDTPGVQEEFADWIAP